MRIIIDKPKLFEALFHAVFTLGAVLVFFHFYHGIGLRAMLAGLAGGIGFLVVWYGTDLLRAISNLYRRTTVDEIADPKKIAQRLENDGA